VTKAGKLKPISINLQSPGAQSGVSSNLFQKQRCEGTDKPQNNSCTIFELSAVHKWMTAINTSRTDPIGAFAISSRIPIQLDEAVHTKRNRNHPAISLTAEYQSSEGENIHEMPVIQSVQVSNLIQMSPN
jgi:hypothetical protein